jgi:hypothetical protein
VLAMVRPGELILNRSQQYAVMSHRAGVPRFAEGGYVQPASGGRSDGPIEVLVDVHVGMSQSGAEEIFVAGGNTRNGENVIVRQLDNARLRKGQK